MLEYIAIAILELFTGLIGFSDRQAALRFGSLKPVKGRRGVYEITGQVFVKVGEVIGLENPDKMILSKVDPTLETVEFLACQEAERIEAQATAMAEEMAEKILTDQGLEDPGSLADPPGPEDEKESPGQDPIDIPGQEEQMDGVPGAGTQIQGFMDSTQSVTESPGTETPAREHPSILDLAELSRAAGQAIEAGRVTGSGAPEVAAMEEILGYDVTAGQRDEAWKIWKKEQTNA